MYVKKIIPAPVPEFIRDRVGRIYKISDLLAKCSAVTTINLRKVPHNSKHDFKQLEWLSKSTLDDIRKKYPHKTRLQCYNMQIYATKRLKKLK